jgi:hypothetical protein
MARSGPTQLSKGIFGIAFTMAECHVWVDHDYEPIIWRLTHANVRLKPLEITDTFYSRPFPAPECPDVFSFAMKSYEIFEVPTRLETSKLLRKDGVERRPRGRTWSFPAV